MYLRKKRCEQGGPRLLCCKLEGVLGEVEDCHTWKGGCVLGIETSVPPVTLTMLPYVVCRSQHSSLQAELKRSDGLPKASARSLCECLACLFVGFWSSMACLWDTCSMTEHPLAWPQSGSCWQQGWLCLLQGTPLLRKRPGLLLLHIPNGHSLRAWLAIGF